MTDAQACVWTLCLAALVLCALTGPLVAVLTPLPPRPPFTSWPPPSPRPSSAPTWPSPPCSSPPSCASCGPARPTIGSPLGKLMGCPPRGTTRPAVLVPQAAIHGTRRHYPWSHLGTTPAVSWSHRGHFRGTNRGARTKTVVPAWSLVSHGKLGLWDHRGPSPLSWGRDHGWSWDHSTVGPRMVPAPRRGGPAPRAATGHRVGGDLAALTADCGT